MLWDKHNNTWWKQSNSLQVKCAWFCAFRMNTRKSNTCILCQMTANSHTHTLSVLTMSDLTYFSHISVQKNLSWCCTSAVKFITASSTPWFCFVRQLVVLRQHDLLHDTFFVGGTLKNYYHHITYTCLLSPYGWLWGMVGCPMGVGVQGLSRDPQPSNLSQGMLGRGCGARMKRIKGGPPSWF